MKKLLKLLIVIMSLTLSLGIFTACGETHEHEYSVLKYNGTHHWYECSCGGMSGTEAHKGGTATETAKAVCEVCSQQYGETLSHVHEFSEQVESELYLKSAANCTSKASYYYSCACGEKGNRTFEVGEALGHNYEKVVTAPKCEVRGYTTYTCACGDTYVADYVDALGHDYGAFTSNGDGTHSKVCANDENHVITANCTGGTAVCEDKAICEVCDTAYGTAPGHEYTRKVTPATCLEKGYTTYTCSCGESYVGNYVDAKGHIYTAYISPATCLEEGYVYYSCTCGEIKEGEVLDILPHEYSNWQDLGNGYAYQMCVNGCDDMIIAKMVDAKVLYSADDKALELSSLRNAGVNIASLAEINGYIVNGEEVEVLDLEVIISGSGQSRTVDVAQEVVLSIGEELYYLPSVYAYTKVIDEAEDLKVFTLTGATEENKYNAVDGYYVLAKNIDASALVLAEHKFMSGAVYPGNGYNADVGFKGVLDGQGYTIDGLSTKSNGLFGNTNAPIIKDIAFTNVNLSGYYSSLFAHNITRSKDVYGDFTNQEALLSNIYVSVASATTGGSKRIGILANNTLAYVVDVKNVIVEYKGVSEAVQSQIEAGNSFYMFGSSGLSMANQTSAFIDCYAISTAPVLQLKKMPGFAENQVEYTLDEKGTKIISVGKVLDSQVTEVLERCAKTLTVEHVIVGLKAYDNYVAMANAKNDYSSFNSAYWTIKNGVPFWKSYYYDNLDVRVLDGKNVVEGDVVLSDAETELTIAMQDMIGGPIAITVTSNNEAVVVEGNVIKLAEKPFKNANYEVTVSAVVDGIEFVKTINVIVIPKGIDVNAVVNYSADDKELDFDAINAELGTSFTANDVVSYTIGNETEERFGEIEIPVVISNYTTQNRGRDRSIEAQVVRVIIDNEIYVLNNVYAYTKVIDEAEDLKVFTLKGATEENPYNEVDGYYILANDIDASELELDAHTFMSGAIYPGNGVSVDVGFRGVFDGQGYTIDGLTTKSCGLFATMNAPVVKNIAFTNANIGGYYACLFAQSYTRGKDYNNDFNNLDGLFENVYVSVNSINYNGSNGSIGVFVYGTLPGTVDLENVVVDYLNVDATAQSKIEAGSQFYMIGSTTGSMASSTDRFVNCYSISTAPVLQRKAMPGFAENQVEYTLTGNKVTAVGNVLDPQVTEVLERCGKTLTVDHVLVGLKAYATYADMSKANNDLSSFDSKYWTIANGVPYWNGTYANHVYAVLRDANGDIVTNAVLDSADTKLTYNFEDGINALEGATITAPEGVKVEGNVISLASAPTGKGEYEISISIVVEGETLTDTVTIAYTNEKVIADKVLYSAADKALDLTSLNAAGVEIESLADIDGYEVDGTPTEELELEVIVSGAGQTRVVDTAQLVKVEIDGKVYVLQNVYAYTKVIDEAEDLHLFTLKGATTENPYNGVYGYYVLSKNIDASELVLAEHTFISGAVYPGNGYSADNGFEGVLDGQGYTIDGLALKSNGLFGQTMHSVIKNIAFTNVTLSGNYKTVFAHNINRGKNPNNTFSAIEVLIENVYISVDSVATGTARVGILANNNMYTGAAVKNVIVEYLAYEEHVQTNIAAGRAFYMLGSPNKDNAATSAVAGTAEYTDVYTISKAPVLAHKLRPGIAINQIECTYTGNKVTAVGAITDADTQAYVTALNVSVDLNNLMHGVKAYDDYAAMKAANNDYSSFSSAYWTITNGVPVWTTAM